FERHWHHCADETSMDALQVGHGRVGIMFVSFRIILNATDSPSRFSVKFFKLCEFRTMPITRGVQNCRSVYFPDTQDQPAMEAMSSPRRIGSNGLERIPRAPRSLRRRRSADCTF